MIKSIDCWDDNFFKNWIDLHYLLYSSRTDVLPEALADFKKILSAAELFPDQRWVAVTVFDQLAPVARALVTVSSLKPELAKVGFIECVDDESIFKALWSEVECKARELGARSLKGPINFHFFHSYRMKIWGKSRPFYGEPQQPAYYQRLLESVGMQKLKTWDTFRIRFFRSRRQYGEIRTAKKPEHVLRIRSIRMSDFDREMAIIHKLFCETFSQMPEFEPVSLEAFKHLYSGFRYIISPLFAFIIEHEGTPVAFCVNFMDPQHVLLQHERLKKYVPESVLNLWTLLRLKLNFKRLLIMYVGRLPAPGGQEFKGIQSLVAKKMNLPVALSIPELYICYTAEDSPALKSYKEDQKEMLAQYGIWGKSLE